MPTKHNKAITKSVTSKQRPKRLNRKTLLFIVVVLLAVSLPPAWITYINYRDKKRFTDAEQLLNEISNQLVANFGKNESENIEQCSRVSTKTGKGPISCVVGKGLYYNSLSETNADKRMQTINSFITQNGRVQNTRYPYKKLIGFENLKDQESYFTNLLSFTDLVSKMDCSAQYTRDISL